MNRLTDISIANEKASRIYFFIMDLLGQEDIDKKLLMFITLCNTFTESEKQKYNVAPLAKEIKKFLTDVRQRTKLDLFYVIKENQEEARALFDDRYADKPIYEIENYPYKELIEFEIKIHEKCGEIILGLPEKERTGLQNIQM